MAATFDTTEQRILKIIDDNRETIVEFARDIYDHAELGYKEFRTSKKFVDFMKSLQLPVQTDLAITGAKAYLNKEKAGNASLALIGELDALRIPQHAHANQETQAAHCCGHHAQLAGVIGAALALTDAEVAQKLDGQVIFFATPAEEYGEIEFKNQLITDGKIAYGGGKCELIRIGAFDDVDVAPYFLRGNPAGKQQRQWFCIQGDPYQRKSSPCGGMSGKRCQRLIGSKPGVTGTGTEP